MNGTKSWESTTEWGHVILQEFADKPPLGIAENNNVGTMPISKLGLAVQCTASYGVFVSGERGLVRSYAGAVIALAAWQTDADLSGPSVQCYKITSAQWAHMRQMTQYVRLKHGGAPPQLIADDIFGLPIDRSGPGDGQAPERVVPFVVPLLSLFAAECFSSCAPQSNIGAALREAWVKAGVLPSPEIRA
ncbi:hypothetical protein KBD11_01240 [Candidatus Saccharibacteria bacterium]|nr:hypothetical protein [Candidatus Saccharibacteria bacterium]